MKLILTGSILAAAMAILTGCHSAPSTPTAPVQTMQARIVQSRLQQASLNVRATGTLHARQTAVLSAQVMGRVQQVLVREGDSVKAGQTLAVLDDATLRASAQQADASVRAAENQQAAAQTNSALAASTLARYRQLQVQKSVSPQELDEVSHRADAAAAQVEAYKAQQGAAKAQASGAHAMLSYTRIRAPFAGVVTARMADPGVLASPGVPLLQVDSAGPLQLLISVDESVIASIRKGMRIPIAIDSAPAAAASAVVAEIVPTADPSSHTFAVKLDVAPSHELHSGMYGTAAIPTGSRQAILVARSAIVQRGSLPCAYVLDSNGVAQLRYITLGSTQGNLVEVLSGISPGESLVDDPADRDLAGKRIEVQP